MRTSSRNLDRFETTFDHDGIVANAGLIVGNVDGSSRFGNVDRPVGQDRFGEPWPQDPDCGRGDARRWHPYRSRQHAAGRGNRGGCWGSR